MRWTRSIWGGQPSTGEGTRQTGGGGTNGGSHGSPRLSDPPHDLVCSARRQPRTGRRGPWVVFSRSTAHLFTPETMFTAMPMGVVRVAPKRDLLPCCWLAFPHLRLLTPSFPEVHE